MSTEGEPGDAERNARLDKDGYDDRDVREGQRLLVAQHGRRWEQMIDRGGTARCAASAAACYVRVNNVSKPKPPIIVYGPLTAEQAAISASVQGENWHEGYWHHA